MPADEAYGLMFHHFTDHRHAAGQGAISAATFEAMLRREGLARILSPEDWTERALAGTLEPHHRCITFDDALKCQIDVALPVLDALGLKAFFFVYSSVFEGALERLEVYRHYRTVAFPSVEAFYDTFDAAVAASAHGERVAAALRDFVPESYLAAFPFYSRGDRIFRYLRDQVLGEEAYVSIMDGLVEAWRADRPDLAAELWMTDADLDRLIAGGHTIGLHSYSHPTVLGALPAERQREEYARNAAHLARRGIRPRVMSHPCNSYSSATLALLREMGVELGFCSNRGAVASRSLLETPREDHANILAAMRAEGFVEAARG
jgi:peptidoglycan/xylan/chitin deacetylase (PgdA/CDA1 family)